MSFEVSVFFPRVPEDLASKVQTSLDELGVSGTFVVPRDWEAQGLWYLLDEPDQEPESGLLIEVSPLSKGDLDLEDRIQDERALMEGSTFRADISTRLSAGTAALMLAGAIARSTGGIELDCQGAAFEEAFERDLARFRGPRGSPGSPTLAERGVYDSELAWRVAQAASAHESRELAKREVRARQSDTGIGAVATGAADQPAPSPRKSVSWVAVLVGLWFLLWAVHKLHQAGWF